MKVAIFNTKPYDREFLTQTNENQHELVFLDTPLNTQTAILASGCTAACCFVNDQIDEQTLHILSSIGIKLIALRCAGFNQVNLQAAKKLNICIARVPEYSPHAIAEHALALILMLDRHLHRSHYRIRENDYSLNGLLGFDLQGKTVAVIGTGKIGQVFAKIMQALGCKVIANDPIPNQTLADGGVQYLSLDELWPQADIISLHCPLTPSTQHLISTGAIQKMKSGVMLINTSRGGLIDTVAVIQTLKSQQIGYLGLDVYEEEAGLFFEDNSEKLLQDDVFARLLTFANVVITGHQAFFTREALTAISKTTIANITNFENGNMENVFCVS